MEVSKIKKKIRLAAVMGFAAFAPLVAVVILLLAAGCGNVTAFATHDGYRAQNQDCGHSSSEGASENNEQGYNYMPSAKNDEGYQEPNEFSHLDEAERRVGFEAGPFYPIYHLLISLESEIDYRADAAIRLSQAYGINIIPEELEFSISTFSWLDYVSPEQFVIAVNYLRENWGAQVGEHHFADHWIPGYAFYYLSADEVRHYDNISIEDMPDSPRRIIVRMYEGWHIVSIEARRQAMPGEYVSGFVGRFGRNLID